MQSVVMVQEVSRVGLEGASVRLCVCVWRGGGEGKMGSADKKGWVVPHTMHSPSRAAPLWEAEMVGVSTYRLFSAGLNCTTTS